MANSKCLYAGTPVSVSGRYTFIQAQPLYGFSNDRHEIGGTASAKFNTNWRIFGSATYDLGLKDARQKLDRLFL